jgi:hypothetical protein
MTRSHLLFAVAMVAITASCKNPEPFAAIPEPVKAGYGKDSLALGPEAYYDKVLGALVGSAIGDAMGASTEMWQRGDIRQKYGYITGLTPAVRNQSPEGTWEHNLGPGATTDDTRWKLIMVKYFSEYADETSSHAFAEFIVRFYESVASGLSGKALLSSPDELDGKLEKIDWIKEWARVALAYQENADAYLKAMNRFYGGEMSCAGMLYSPMFGLLANSPEEAYHIAYEHSIFDLGYAKDISGLVAGMTQMALQTSSMDSILDTAIFIDPYRYQDSRLVGRISLDIANASRKIVWASKELPSIEIPETHANAADIIPDGYPYAAVEWDRQSFVYSYLDKHKKAIPFHAGEIWQILNSALEFGEGDFVKTMQFIVNYGRDNDTVAAVAGMILGAKLGYSGLPESMRNTVVRANRDQIGIDLEALARELTARNTGITP